MVMVFPCRSYLLDFSELVASGEEGSDADDTAKCGDGVEDVISGMVEPGSVMCKLSPGFVRNVNKEMGREENVYICFQNVRDF